MEWQLVLRGLLNPERRVPPGRLSLPDLQRLVSMRSEQHRLLLTLGKELLEGAPSLDRWAVARRLEAMAVQGKQATDLLIMLREVLMLYEDPKEMASKVGLDVNWQRQVAEELKAMDLQLQRAILRALPPGWLGRKE